LRNQTFLPGLEYFQFEGFGFQHPRDFSDRRAKLVFRRVWRRAGMDATKQSKRCD
jgi:hypothetical protein